MSKAEFYYKDKNAPKPNKPNHIGVSVIIEYNNKILLEHRTDSETWAVIGGGLKIDETLIQCAIRETKEETGIKLANHKLTFCNIYDDPSRIASYSDDGIKRIITVVYKVTLEQEPNLICSKESRELKFFSKDELKNITIAKTHIPIIEDYIYD